MEKVFSNLPMLTWSRVIYICIVESRRNRFVQLHHFYLFLLTPSSLIVNITNTIDNEFSIASRWIKELWVMADLHFWIKTGCRRIIRIPYDLNMKATIMYCNLFLHSVEIARHNFNVNIKRTEVKHSTFDNDL